MDLRQIQYFLCLYEEKTVTRAARRLNIVQPALSMQIAKIEGELGQPLFVRTSQGMVPTAAARTMYQRFLPILRDLSSAQQEIASLSGKVTGHISVGLITSVTQSVLAQSLAAFAAEYAEVEVTVNEGYSEDLIDRVTAGNLDLAVINRPRKNVGLVTDPILQEEFVAVTGRAKGPALPNPVTLPELVPHKLILPSQRNGLRKIVDHHAEQAGVELHPKIELDALSSIAELVAYSDWVTVLPSILVHRGFTDGLLRRHNLRAPITRELVWIQNPQRPLIPAAKRLIEVIGGNLMRAADQRQVEHVG